MDYSLKYQERNQGAHKFIMWLAIASSCMIFAGFTSAFLVRKGAGGAWTGFDISSVFSISTFIILFSSATMLVAHIANKKGNLGFASFALFLTFACGLLFCYFQYTGWVYLTNQGFYPAGNPNPSPQFLFVIVIIHAIHVLSGMLFLLIASVKSFMLLKSDKQLVVNPNSNVLQVRTDLLSMYWHFMGILWLYLFGFLYFFL
ncbi:MAG TPA: cytochrome c oxidase subunit 3 [Chitinophagales bacterium]|nr:cytochrome c oxidase subunit 3 [Chitinophagales bacterium]MCB0511787.1 heme-copper oxidase subunit III [Bacteroidota bacterium]MCB9075135.1 heme-copper oxidase subunit III [Chitinophagales bacterium]HMU99284.1 cytochrome c oxidase subunit 3 [Chitinophagales bacterium]HMV02834.1 cytochrome c oxidase subunit 3 [Chitinophagales bacterium]